VERGDASRFACLEGPPGAARGSRGGREGPMLSLLSPCLTSPDGLLPGACGGRVWMGRGWRGSWSWHTLPRTRTRCLETSLPWSLEASEWVRHCTGAPQPLKDGASGKPAKASDYEAPLPEQTLQQSLACQKRVRPSKPRALMARVPARPRLLAGTPALTSRGFVGEDFARVAEFFDRAVE